MSKIASRFCVPIENQHLFDKDNRRVDLLVGPLSDVGIVDGRVLVLVSLPLNLLI